MSAGLGFKDFSTGEVLTSADVDGYLMQGIWVFASAAARDAAVTSPQEGNACYLKDTDVIQVYTGSAWAAQSASNPISANIVDAKGDLIVGTAADTVSRLAVGANGTTLVADSAEATGLKWAAASSGGMTLINSGGTTLTGASITISSIPGTYKNLQLVIRNFLPATNNQSIRMRLNGVTTTTYAADAVDANDVAAFTNEITPGGNSSNSVSNSLIYATITDYTNTTTYKMVEMQGITTNATTTANINYRTNMGWFYNTNAITSITLFPNSGNFTSGTAFLYGVQ